MKTILLARHGTHAEVGRFLSGRSDIALSQPGAIEAEALAGYLSGRPLAAIHSSPRRRTRQTADAVAHRTGLAVQTAPALDEIDFGRFGGKSFAALGEDDAWQRWNAERDTARCPNGETMREAVDRALAFLTALPSSAAPILCVTHCDIIRGIVAHVLGLPFSRMFALDCAPASLTTIAMDGRDTRLVTLNEHGWLRRDH